MSYYPPPKPIRYPDRPTSRPAMLLTHDAFGLIGTTLSEKISVFRSSSLRTVPETEEGNPSGIHSAGVAPSGVVPTRNFTPGWWW